MVRRVTSYYVVMRRSTTYYDVLARTTTHHDVPRRTTTYYDALHALRCPHSTYYDVLRRTTTTSYYDVPRHNTTYWDAVQLVQTTKHYIFQDVQMCLIVANVFASEAHSVRLTLPPCFIQSHSMDCSTVANVSLSIGCASDTLCGGECWC